MIWARWYMFLNFKVIRELAIVRSFILRYILSVDWRFSRIKGYLLINLKILTT